MDDLSCKTASSSFGGRGLIHNATRAVEGSRLRMGTWPNYIIDEASASGAVDSRSESCARLFHSALFFMNFAAIVVLLRLGSKVLPGGPRGT